MIDRLAEVRRRRAELVDRAARERDDLGRLVGAVTQPVRAAGWLSAAWRFASARPLVVGGAVAAIVILRPSRAIAWSLRLWAGWQAFQRMRERFALFTTATGGRRSETPAAIKQPGPR
jgi:hypothetical protein